MDDEVRVTEEKIERIKEGKVSEDAMKLESELRGRGERIS